MIFLSNKIKINEKKKKLFFIKIKKSTVNIFINKFVNYIAVERLDKWKTP